MIKKQETRLAGRGPGEGEYEKMLSMCQSKSLYIIINDEGGPVKKALAYIPENSRPEAIRLLKIVEKSGQEETSALQALYRWLCGRDHYIEIYLGLEMFFKNEVFELCK